MITYDTGDRRRHARVRKAARVILTGPDARCAYHFTCDISGGGIYAVAEQAPPLGSLVGVEIAVGGQVTRFKTQGVVVRDDTRGKPSRRRPLGFAIHFVGLSDTQRVQLLDLIDALCQGPAAQSTTTAQLDPTPSRP